MKFSVRRMLAVSTATAVAAVGTLALTAPVAAGTTTAATAAAQAAPVAAKKAAKKKKKTVYGMSARAFGTQINADALGVRSDRTAYSHVACTTGNRSKQESLVGANVLPDSSFLDVGVVRTQTLSRKGKKARKIGFPKGTKAGTLATSKVAEVTLAGVGPLNLKLEGLTSEARAWVNKKGKFKTSQKHGIVDLTANTGIAPLDELLNGSDSPLQVLIDLLTGSIVKPGIEVVDGVLKAGGLGEISLGKSKTKTTKRNAISQATVLDIRLYGADRKPGGQGPEAGDIRVQLGLARAQVMKGFEKGRFGGQATALHAGVLDGVVGTAKLAYQPIPCTGTQGKTKKQGVAGVDLLGLGQVKVDTVYTTIMAKPGKKKAGKAVSRAETARVVVGGENGLVINAISAKAVAKRNKIGKLKRKTKVNLGDIKLGGTPIDLDQLLKPTLDVVDQLLSIGIGSVKTHVKTRTGSGVRVIALQIKLLDGQLLDLKVGDVTAKVFKKARK